MVAVAAEHVSMLEVMALCHAVVPLPTALAVGVAEV
jgi:hypothetical protein